MSRETTALVGVVKRESESLEIISGSMGDNTAEIVVLDHDQLVAHLQFDGTNDLVGRALAACADQKPERPWHTGQGVGLTASVIISTLGKTPLLVTAVRAVLNQSHKNFELIVVDNDPASGDTPRLLAEITDPRLTIVPEATRGLSYARNRGVKAALGEVVAFTDDDASTPPQWLASMLDALAGTGAAAVTGPVFARELRFAPQRYFESRGGFPKGLEPKLWSVDSPDGGPFYPYGTARVGAGVNMAFRRAAVPVFDTALGAGTPSNGGEDLDGFAQVLQAGGDIIYNPDAFVFHVHRRDLAGLKRQIYGNGTGMAALLSKTILHHPTVLVKLLRRIPQIARRVAPGSQRVTGTVVDTPKILSLLEARGFLVGPFLYLKGRL